MSTEALKLEWRWEEDAERFFYELNEEYVIAEIRSPQWEGQDDVDFEALSEFACDSFCGWGRDPIFSSEFGEIKARVESEVRTFARQLAEACGYTVTEAQS